MIHWCCIHSRDNLKLPQKKNSTTICLPWVFSESPSLKDCESRRHAVFALEFFRCSLHILTWSIWASPCLNFTDFTVLEPRPTISYRYLPWPCFTNTKLVQIIIISCMLIILRDDTGSICFMLQFDWSSDTVLQRCTGRRWSCRSPDEDYAHLSWHFAANFECHRWFRCDLSISISMWDLI